MKKCLLYALLFAQLFIGLFVVSSSASAATQYDEVLRNTQTLTLQNDSCEPYDLLTQGFITPKSPGIQVHENNEDDLQEYIDAYIQAEQTGNIAIVVRTQPNSKNIVFLYTQQPGAIMEFAGQIDVINNVTYDSRVLRTYGTTENRMYHVALTISSYSGCEPMIGTFSKSNVYQTLSSPPADYSSELYYSNIPFTQPPNYEGEQPNVEIPDDVPQYGEIDEGCDALDMLCWFGSFVGSVVDGFQALGDLFVGLITALGDMIANLIVPSTEPGATDIFTSAFNDLKDYMHNKLGILLFPFQFVAQQVAALMTIVDSHDKSEWHCTHVDGSSEYSTCRGVCFNNVLGNNELCPLQVGKLEATFPTLWNTGIFFLRLTVFVTMIELLRRKYMEITKA